MTPDTACFAPLAIMRLLRNSNTAESRRVVNVAFFLLIAMGLSAPVEASPPLNRTECALGWLDADIDTAQTVATPDPFGVRLSARGGEGGAISCSVRIHSGLYAYGDLGQVDAHLDVSVTVDNDTEVESFDLDAEFRRIGLGYELPVADEFKLYGQIGYLYSDYDFEPIFVIQGSGPAQSSRADLRNDGNGIDFEAGLTWTSSETLTLSGFARFAERNRLTFGGPDTPIFAIRNEDDTRIGAQLRLRLAEPVYLTAEAEFGHMDLLFVGLGARF